VIITASRKIFITKLHHQNSWSLVFTAKDLKAKNTRPLFTTGANTFGVQGYTHALGARMH